MEPRPRTAQMWNQYFHISSKVKMKAKWLRSALTLQCSLSAASSAVYWPGQAFTKNYNVSSIERAEKKISQIQDFPFGLWLSRIDGSEPGEGCCFCPGYRFGSDQGTQNTGEHSGWPGNPCSDTGICPSVWACIFDDRSLRKCECFHRRFYFVTWPSLLSLSLHLKPLSSCHDKCTQVSLGWLSQGGRRKKTNPRLKSGS